MLWENTRLKTAAKATIFSRIKIKNTILLHFGCCSFLESYVSVGLAIRRHSRNAHLVDATQRRPCVKSRTYVKRLVLSQLILIVCVLMNKCACVILALLNTVNQVIKISM